MMDNDQDFAEVTRTLRSAYAGDRLTRSLWNDVRGTLEHRPIRGRRALAAPLTAAALFLAGLIALIALPRVSSSRSVGGGPDAAQESDRQRLELLRREITRVKEEIRALEQEIAKASDRPTPAPGRAAPGAPEIRITAIAREIGLVVISAGKDDGVLEGARFWIYRNVEAIGQIVIDRTDRKWSAGKIVTQATDPKIGDQVVPSN